MRAAVGVIVEFPKMDELIYRAGIALEIPDQLLVLPALKPTFVRTEDRLVTL
jgi:hypothetical protein